MKTIYLVLIGAGGELARVTLEVQDPDNCEREVMEAMNRERWVLSVGDRIEIQAQA